tara:strand:- start:529 stop:660 length:132 start_codon:yes stop_codon:yes gene_type:complete
MNEAIRRLTEMLEWSDRLGSDERHEIEFAINILKMIKRVNEES